MIVSLPMPNAHTHISILKGVQNFWENWPRGTKRIKSNMPRKVWKKHKEKRLCRQ